MVESALFSTSRGPSLQHEFCERLLCNIASAQAITMASKIIAHNFLGSRTEKNLTPITTSTKEVAWQFLDARRHVNLCTKSAPWFHGTSTIECFLRTLSNSNQWLWRATTLLHSMRNRLRIILIVNIGSSESGTAKRYHKKTDQKGASIPILSIMFHTENSASSCQILTKFFSRFKKQWQHSCDNSHEPSLNVQTHSHNNTFYMTLQTFGGYALRKWKRNLVLSGFYQERWGHIGTHCCPRPNQGWKRNSTKILQSFFLCIA